MVAAAAGWREYLEGVGFEPEALITGTYDDRWDLSLGPWQVEKHWRQLVRELNRVAFPPGIRWKRRCKHSYFGYFMVVEQQRRGQQHFHAVVDNWVDWSHAISYWKNRFGRIDIRPADEGSLPYLLKYVSKAGVDPQVWIAEKRWRMDVRTVQLNGPPPAEGGSAPKGRAVKAAERSVP